MGDEPLTTDHSFDQRAINNINFRQRSTSICFVAALSALLFCAPAGLAQGGDKPVLAQLEQRLFMKSYDNDSDDNRIARLEKQVFGSTMEGSLHGRLERILAAVSPQENPDGSVSGLKPQQPQQSQQPSQQQQQAAVPQLQPAAQTEPGEDEREAAAQRAQVAVQAAREENINRLLGQGVQFGGAKQYRQALEKFDEVLRLDPHNPEANFSRGVVCENLGNFREALASYQRASQDRPDNKDYREAIVAVQRKVSSKQPVQQQGQQQGQESQGEMSELARDASDAYKRGEYQSALELYKRLDLKAPNQALIKYNIGTLYLAIKNPFSALQYYKQARELKPNEPRYITACEQLETNLRNAQQQREQAESAWAGVDQGPGPQGGQGQPMGTSAPTYGQQAPGVKPKKQPKVKQPKVKPPKAAPAAIPSSGDSDPLATIGIIAKSTHDGLCITAVGIASRASRAGLLRGDIIKAIDGAVVNHADQINKILAGKQPGTAVQLTIQRAQRLGQVTL